MSDLLGSLTSAARSLDAQRLGLDVTGQNIANINTAGYTRRTIDLAEIPPSDDASAGNGVEVLRIRAQRAELIEAQLRHELPNQGRQAAMADSLTQIETALGTPGQSLDAVLGQFFDAFSTLAQDPTSGAARQQVVVQGQSLASSFNDVAMRLATARSDADTQIRGGVDQINALASQIAALNASLSAVGSASNETLKDQQTEAIKQLSSLIDVGVVTRADGGMDVSIGNGHALVIGANTYQVGIVPSGVTGLADVTSGGSVITNEISGGRVGGLLNVRDVLVPDYSARLDQLANGVATSVNAAHAAGFDLNGIAGGNFFVPPAGVAGSAQSMAMSAAVIADPRLIAASASTAAGDNQNARAIAALGQTPIAGATTTPVDTWGALVYRVGTDAAVAKSEQNNRNEIVQQLEGLRDQTSGISLDEEAANMMKFQRAYEASAKYFSAVDHALDTLMGLVASV